MGAALIAVLVDPNNAESRFYEKSAQDGARARPAVAFFSKLALWGEIDTAFATRLSAKSSTSYELCDCCHKR